jgi:hypothetical protein
MTIGGPSHGAGDVGEQLVRGDTLGSRHPPRTAHARHSPRPRPIPRAAMRQVAVGQSRGERVAGTGRIHDMLHLDAIDVLLGDPAGAILGRRPRSHAHQASRTPPRHRGPDSDAPGRAVLHCAAAAGQPPTPLTHPATSSSRPPGSSSGCRCAEAIRPGPPTPVDGARRCGSASPSGRGHPAPRLHGCAP